MDRPKLVSHESGWAAGHEKELTADTPVFPVPAYNATRNKLLADQAFKAWCSYFALTTISSVVTQKVIHKKLFLTNVSRSLVRNPNKVWSCQFLSLASLWWLPTAFWKNKETNSLGFPTVKWKRVSFVCFVLCVLSPVYGTEATAACQEERSGTHLKAWQKPLEKRKRFSQGSR